jgi:class 3 adenylate cyclase
MRRGLRFQTKLMLTFVAAIAMVTFALIYVTETKVSQAYTRQFSKNFKDLVRQLERSREERSQDFLELSRHLAAHPYVVSSLKEENASDEGRAFWRDYLEELKEIDGQTENRPDAAGKPAPLPTDLVQRYGSIGLVDTKGEIRTLHPPGAGGSREGEKRRFASPRFRQSPSGVNRAKKRIDELLASDGQETLFLPFETPDGTGFIQEMVSTPVKDPESGALLGLFLRATSAETEAQRFLERYQEEFQSDTPLLTGIFLDGQVYSRAIPIEMATRMSAAIADEIVRHSELPRGEDLAFESDLDGVPHRFYVKPLDHGEGTATAFQVSAFSLAPLKADLAELRLRGSGVGGAALLIGIGIAWLFSRRLAVPIAELTRATRAVRDGHLETRIDVRTRDEIGELAESFNEMTEGLQQRDAYRGILGKVSDETVAQAMISGDLDLELGGELKTVSVLFCDIRGFTGQTEHMHPTEIIGLLNEHMTAMTAIVRKHYGVVDKFVGDEIMAVFGALKSYGNDAGHAVACALEMIAERDRLNQNAKHPIEVGIGVATGEAVAGCMGSVDRLNYTVIGARVNLASRLCSEAGVMEVVIDDQTLSCLESDRVGNDRVESEAIEDLRLKGFSANVTAYRVREQTTAAVLLEP